jgi:hypothetical protein
MLPEKKYCNITDTDEVSLQASARNGPSLSDPHSLKAVNVSRPKQLRYKFD